MKPIDEQLADAERAAADANRRVADLRAVADVQRKHGDALQRMPLNDLRALIVVATGVYNARRTPPGVVELRKVINPPTVRLSAEESAELAARIRPLKSKVHG